MLQPTEETSPKSPMLPSTRNVHRLEMANFMKNAIRAEETDMIFVTS